MKAIDRAKEHYSRLAGQPTRIEVPEWGDDDSPLVIFATPLTLYERMRLQRSNKSGSDIEAAVELLILKAQDAQGNAVFSREDKNELLRGVDSKVIGRIAEAIIGKDDDLLLEDAEKN